MHCVSSVIQDQLLLLLFLFPSLGMSEKPEKNENNQFLIILMVVKTFSASCFLDKGLKSQQGTAQLFSNKIKFEGFTIDFKSNKWLLWSKSLELDKKKRPFLPFFLKKADLTRTIKVPPNLPASTGKFPPVTCGNSRQSLPAEIFACIRRYFYLRISLPAAFAGNFARASFTVLGSWRALPITRPNCFESFLISNFVLIYYVHHRRFLRRWYTRLKSK